MLKQSLSEPFDQCTLYSCDECGAGKFQNALAWQGADMDMDEVECIVANLIFRRYIKGYISHKNLVVVISKVDAFPPLKNAALKQS